MERQTRSRESKGERGEQGGTHTFIALSLHGSSCLFSPQAQVLTAAFCCRQQGPRLGTGVTLKGSSAATHDLCCQSEQSLTSPALCRHSESIWLWGEKSKSKPVLPTLSPRLQDLLEQQQRGDGSTDHGSAPPESHLLSCLLSPSAPAWPAGLPPLPPKANATGENKADTTPGGSRDFLCQQFSPAAVSLRFWSVLLIYRPLAREGAELPPRHRPRAPSDPKLKHTFIFPSKPRSEAQHRRSARQDLPSHTSVTAPATALGEPGRRLHGHRSKKRQFSSTAISAALWSPRATAALPSSGQPQRRVPAQWRW